MREDIENAHRGKRRNSGILGRSGPAGFIIESDNVSLEVHVKNNLFFHPISLYYFGENFYLN